MRNWNERIGNLFLSVSRRDALRKTIMLPGSSIQIKETLLKKNLREKIYSLTKRFSPDQNVEVTKKNRRDEGSQLIIIITDITKFFAHALYSHL